MTLQNNNDTKARTKQTTLSSTLVRCLCVTISFVTTGLALLAFGLTCFLLRLFDGAAPCPHTLILTVFGVSGGLLGLGLVLLLCVCRRKKRLTKEALLDDLPEVCSDDVAQYRKKMSIPGDASQESHGKVNGEDVVEKDLPPPLEDPLTNNGGDAFDLTQHMTATAGSDVVQSGRPIFDDFFQHLWPYIGNNTANVVFQMVKRLWLIRLDQ
ncbi:uncharacterized protein TNCV_2395111 [Trichonephila clavipes]|nr:uncharacterized protein TNCV_2395111 [Trichonephila clavipes]